MPSESLDEHVIERMYRVVPREPYRSLEDYTAAGGGAGLTAARQVTSDAIIEEIRASGLRGRGGAGFPTGLKWRSVASHASASLHTAIVVNAAEGEPGTFKDRTIVRSNPYAVIEGALIAACALDAKTVVIATKAAFTEDVARLESVIGEIVNAGWAGDVDVRIVEGPSEYLFGEETALLEVIDGRPPFPRIAPPFRRGIVEVVTSAREASSGSGLSANVQMAGTEPSSGAPPVLVNNVETLANVPGIIARGADWFRSIGTPESPGSIVCTVTGDVVTPGVAEVPMGTSLRDAIDVVGGGLLPDRRVQAVLVGVSSAVILPDRLDTVLTYEAMAAIGSGIGSAGFMVYDDQADMVAVAAGVARFLAIESCGQCTRCKLDGADIARLLATAVLGDGAPADLVTLRNRLSTVADGARCSLASQQQVVVGSIVEAFDERLQVLIGSGSAPVEVRLVAALTNIDVDGAHIDETFPDKRPDWTFSAVDSGKSPVDLLLDHRAASPSA